MNEESLTGDVLNDHDPIVGPIVGFKTAQLVREGDRMLLAPRFPRRKSRPYGVDADAVCEHPGGHAPSMAACRCGFYAVRSRAELLRLGFVPEAVVLDVELSGTVIEHEYGWRATHQSVLGVHLPPWCEKRRCERPVVGVARHRGGVEGFGSRGYDLMAFSSPLRPMCARCAKKRLISVADLAAALRVEVSVDAAVQSDEGGPGTRVRRPAAGGIGMFPPVFPRSGSYAADAQGSTRRGEESSR